MRSGTTVFRIYEELETEDPDSSEKYTLKVIWRDPKRDSESEVLEHFYGKFGLAQSIWHRDVSTPGVYQCPTPVDEWCTTYVDKTVQVDRLEACDNLRDISAWLLEGGGGGNIARPIETTEHYPTSYVRPLRIHSYTLMESIGIPLQNTESPRRLLTAVLDAILGYWGAFNLGIAHRNITYQNVLIPKANQEFSRKEWLEPHAANSRIQDPVPIDSETMLRSVLEEIGYRNPTGILTDFDFYEEHPHLQNHSCSRRPREQREQREHLSL